MYVRPGKEDRRYIAPEVGKAQLLFVVGGRVDSFEAKPKKPRTFARGQRRALARINV
jgi:hypothetical protein